MKTRFIVAIASLLLSVSLAHATDGDTPVDIPDEKLHFLITLHFKKSPDAAITVSDMAKLTDLSVPRERIQNITGLEFATNLIDLDLSDNRITDLSSLAGLTNLESLDISENPLSDTDLSPIAQAERPCVSRHQQGRNL